MKTVISCDALSILTTMLDFGCSGAALGAVAADVPGAPFVCPDGAAAFGLPSGAVPVDPGADWEAAGGTL
jgi:hypothetical protein